MGLLGVELEGWEQVMCGGAEVWVASSDSCGLSMAWRAVPAKGFVDVSQ